MKNKKNNAKKVWLIKISIVYSKLAPLTPDITCSKL